MAASHHLNQCWLIIKVFYGNHLGAISQEMLVNLSITCMEIKLWNLLPNRPGAHELKVILLPTCSILLSRAIRPMEALRPDILHISVGYFFLQSSLLLFYDSSHLIYCLSIFRLIRSINTEYLMAIAVWQCMVSIEHKTAFIAAWFLYPGGYGNHVAWAHRLQQYVQYIQRLLGTLIRFCCGLAMPDINP